MEKYFSYSLTLKNKKVRSRICSYLLYMIDNDDLKEKYIQLYNYDIFPRYLNLTRSAVSRELHSLQKEESITMEKKIIHILNIEKISQYADE